MLAEDNYLHTLKLKNEVNQNDLLAEPPAIGYPFGIPFQHPPLCTNNKNKW
jgi:hypothetical protein